MIESEATLFRIDSFASKTVVAFLKLEASDTLHEVLGPLVSEIVKNPSGFEVDPSKCKDESLRKKHAEKLRTTAQHFIDTIFSSIEKWNV